MELAGNILDFLLPAFMVAAFIAALLADSSRVGRTARQEEIARRGVEVEAEILGRFLAGAPQGSDLAKSRQVLMTPRDPLELELRYVFEGREIVSRCPVSAEIFFRTRSWNTLKIKVSPEEPHQWAAHA